METVEHVVVATASDAPPVMRLHGLLCLTCRLWTGVSYTSPDAAARALQALHKRADTLPHENV